MTRYLLDTNIVSNLIKPQPNAALLDWMAVQADGDLFVAAMTIAEIRRGVLRLPAGRRRNDLARWFDGPEGPLAIFSDRILAFDMQAALLWAQLMADCERQGRPRGVSDMIIAATAAANDCTIVTDDEKDFSNLAVFNPIRQ